MWGGGNSSPNSKGANGLNNTVWLYNKAEFKTTKPPKPEPEKPKPEKPDNPDPENPDPETPDPEPEKPKPEPNPNYTLDVKKHYVYFAPDYYVFEGYVSWTDTYENNKYVRSSEKVITPCYAGTYKSEPNNQISFSFIYERVGDKSLKVWGNVPKEENGEIVYTPSRLKNDHDSPVWHGLYAHANDISHNSSNLEIVENSDDEGYKAWTTTYWDKDPYGLNKDELCMSASMSKFETENISPAVLTTPADENGKCEFISFQEPKRVASGTLLKNDDEIFGENYKGTYAIDTITQINTMYFQYDSKMYTPNGDHLYDLKRNDEFKLVMTDKNTNKVYTDIGSVPIYATTAERTKFTYKEPEQSGGLYPYMSAATSRHFGGFEQYATLEEYVRDYPSIEPGYTETITNDRYNSNKEWCYQYANFNGYLDGVKSLLFKYSRLPNEGSSGGYYNAYQLIDLEGNEYEVSKLLPGRFMVNKKWVNVTKNALGTNEGANVVDITYDGKKYTMCFENVPIVKEDLNDETLRLSSLRIMPGKNEGLTKAIFADINQETKTVTISLPADWDKSNVVFDYEATEVGDRPTVPCDLYYSSKANDTDVANFTKIERGFRDLGIYVMLDGEHICYGTNSIDKPNKVSTVRTFYIKGKGNIIETVMAFDSQSHISLTETAFLNEVTESDGRAMYKNLYLAAPGKEAARDNGYLTFEAYEYLKKVYLASKEANFKLIDWVEKRPTNFVWVDPSIAPAKTRSVISGTAGYIPTSGVGDRLGYNLNNFKTLMLLYTNSDPNYSKTYQVIFN